MFKKAGRSSAATIGVSSSPKGLRVIIRTVHVKESILRRSLAEVLANPIPFPRLTKVDEPLESRKEIKQAQVSETVQVREAKVGGDTRK